MPWEAQEMKIWNYPLAIICYNNLWTLSHLFKDKNGFQNIRKTEPEDLHVKEEVITNSKFKYKLIFFLTIRGLPLATMWKWRNMCGVRRYDNLSMLLWIHWKYLPRKWVRKSFLSYSKGMNLLLLTPLRPNYRFQWQWYFYEYKTLLFYRIYHYVHNSDYWFEGTIEFKGMSRDSTLTQARPPSHVKLYRA